MARSTHNTKIAILNGAAANTAIALTPDADVMLGPGARNITAVLRVTTGGAVSDITSEVVGVERQSFKLSTTNTTGEKVILIYRHAAGAN